MKQIFKNIIFVLIVIGIVGCGAIVLWLISLFVNPLYLLLLISLSLSYKIIRNAIKRYHYLNKYGYYGGSRKGESCVYEEIINGNIEALYIKLENTEPGHWELFVPTESEWNNIVPSWGVNRRKEIIERIVSNYKLTDVHYPNDY